MYRYTSEQHIRLHVNRKSERDSAGQGIKEVSARCCRRTMSLTARRSAICKDVHGGDSRLYRMILVDLVSSIVSVRRIKRQSEDGSQLLRSSDSRILDALESAAKEYGLVIY